MKGMDLIVPKKGRIYYEFHRVLLFLRTQKIPI
nr:MAG TPA: hypothetical protein [Caudoviricetes sp.]